MNSFTHALLLLRDEYKPRGYYLEHFWQADLGYIGQAIIGVKVPNSSHVACIQHGRVASIILHPHPPYLMVNKKLNTVGIYKSLDYLKGEWHVGVPDRESLTVDGANGDPKAVGAVFGQLGYVGGNLKEFVDNLIKISDTNGNFNFTELFRDFQTYGRNFSTI